MPPGAPLLLLLVGAATAVAATAGAGGTTCPAPPGGGHRTAAQRLHHVLLCAYDTNVRPVADPTRPLHVQLHTWLQSISIEEYSHETLSVNIWIMLAWFDDYLTWDPSLYEGISELYLPTEKIWTPHFVKVEASFRETLRPHRPAEVCSVDNRGSVECIWVATFGLACTFDYQRWPFDSQSCSFKLRAVGYNSSELPMSLDNSSLATLVTTNPQWKLESAHAEMLNESDYILGRGIVTPSLHLHVGLRRRDAAYVAAVCVPAFGGALMTLLPYLMQPSWPQRALLAAAGVVAHIFSLQLLTTIIYDPAGAVLPFIVLLSRDSLVLCSLSLAVSAAHRWLLAACPDPPIALRNASSRLLDIWSRNLHFIRIQAQKVSVEPVTPSADFWQRWTSFVDGSVFAVSVVAYVILLARFLP